MFMLFSLCSFFFFKQKTAYEMRISDWSSDVCSSDLGPEVAALVDPQPGGEGAQRHDALDAEVQHAGALADELAEGAEDERRRHAHQGAPEAQRDEDLDEFHGGRSPQRQRGRKRTNSTLASTSSSAVAVSTSDRKSTRLNSSP